MKEKEEFEKSMDKSKRDAHMRGEKALFCFNEGLNEFDESLENNYTIHLENKIIELRGKLHRAKNLIFGK